SSSSPTVSYCLVVLLTLTLPPSFSFFFSSVGDHRDLHSFPTRRSSDLLLDRVLGSPGVVFGVLGAGILYHVIQSMTANAIRAGRSEEHTSELQSRENLVCRLLLEKKKKKHKSGLHHKIGKE